jgi:hypothetical protein
MCVDPEVVVSKEGGNGEYADGGYWVWKPQVQVEWSIHPLRLCPTCTAAYEARKDGKQRCSDCCTACGFTRGRWVPDDVELDPQSVARGPRLEVTWVAMQSNVAFIALRLIAKEDGAQVKRESHFNVAARGPHLHRSQGYRVLYFSKGPLYLA